MNEKDWKTVCSLAATMRALIICDAIRWPRRHGPDAALHGSRGDESLDTAFDRTHHRQENDVASGLSIMRLRAAIATTIQDAAMRARLCLGGRPGRVQQAQAGRPGSAELAA